jgi:hypothetical protein
MIGDYIEDEWLQRTNDRTTRRIELFFTALSIITRETILQNLRSSMHLLHTIRPFPPLLRI